MVSSAPKRNNVFISYSHTDDKYLRGLLPYLQYFEKNKLIEIWVDTKIKAGDKWREEIKKALSSTKVAILLISVDFLNSPFIAENELPPLLLAAETEGVIILPVVLRPCPLLPPNLSCFQAINSPSKPLSMMEVWKREEIWAKVANETRDAINSRRYMEEKKHKMKSLSKTVTSDDYYAEEMEEALQEFRQSLSLNPTPVLSKQSKIGIEEEYG
jgi:TIR domain